ncbi:MULTISPECIES: ribosomal protein S18-alanine N-acetyltransferase [unclassified Marinobacter]|uniref:ribosomal protein S18-alanine N-acetyltransferase n=1 Tax=unclassified Marinobacter TaxID=83889 RepID=UPI0026E1D306|nr:MULTISPECIES: ribosomal protein S18-alanine N-acetyltransferase [unclassified Marinobacter]MDO6441272.1 ribosomal protein S18-alanine N-acetyltransferase [Marinobacter sp. 2_MG-2023]MDO6825303.1 ribosomal protein S18-alanine N-acetyltransferase [Marinobacter sp. 1_MG-2023]
MRKKVSADCSAKGLDLAIRPLEPEDLPEMLDIELQGYSHPWSEGVFLDCFKPSYRLWGICQFGSLVGYAVVSYILDEVHLLNLCIHPGCRGRGAGRLLLRHLVEEANREGMNQVILEVRLSNSTASKLYRSEGFEEIGRRPRYYPAASGWEDARVMALLLQP